MKICVAQTKPVKGDIQQNLKQHLKLIRLAAEFDVNIMIFPELSLTGYEPELAKLFAIQQNQIQFAEIQQLSNQYELTIGVGFPTQSKNNKDQILISMLIYQPEQPIRIYSKQHLFETELETFIAGQDSVYVSVGNEIVAPAICYELSKEIHSIHAKNNGASVYMASVLNSLSGIEADLSTLSNIAKSHKMTVAMANYIGQSGGYSCAGRSSIWNNRGQLVGQLNAEQEGFLIFDTNTDEITIYYI